MAKLCDVINRVDSIKPNAFSEQNKTDWLNEVEGAVQIEVQLLDIEDVVQYTYATDKNKTLIVPAPFDKLYWVYLSAMIDFANGEYDKYSNTMAVYNGYWGEYMRWYAENYRPADGE